MKSDDRSPSLRSPRHRRDDTEHLPVQTTRKKFWAWAGVTIFAALITSIAAHFLDTCNKQPLLHGRLVGDVVNPSGTPLSGLFVTLSGSSSADTSDLNGNFVLSRAGTGDQTIVIKTPDGTGVPAQHVFIEADQTTKTHVILDVKNLRAGQFPIDSPVSDTEFQLQYDGADYRAMLHGRCAGMSQFYSGGLEVWILIRSFRDGLFHVQNPPATIDPSSGTWQAKAMFGDPEHPPLDGELWEIIAVAADVNSNFSRIAATPRLSQLPPHTASNLVTVRTKVPRHVKDAK